MCFFFSCFLTSWKELGGITGCKGYNSWMDGGEGGSSKFRLFALYPVLLYVAC